MFLMLMIISFILMFSKKILYFKFKMNVPAHVLLHHGIKNVQLLPMLCQLLSLSRFFSVFESMLGRFKAARNLFTAASPIPENKIAIKYINNNSHLQKIICYCVLFYIVILPINNYFI